MRRQVLLALCPAMLALAGCGGPKAYVRAGFLDHPPERVANNLTRSPVEDLSRSPAVLAYVNEQSL